ncbi:hypothetical protein Q31b_01890 [Novipirellula aureliae]|uniref:Uncharacterized protein n=1 Tax=Novipirellula aureliae TaxID=2527966 RepID=A0A5C6E879_9BACT|nr:hypothetical protein [Novipirellula aureliae]TWU45018.1 hypothetical protein Q31b_01890 [Novipirellula aureliae]
MLLLMMLDLDVSSPVEEGEVLEAARVGKAERATERQVEQPRLLGLLVLIAAFFVAILLRSLSVG